MTRVFYGSPQNAWLGGHLFLDGICTFDNDAEGKRFAEMFYKKYEVEPTEEEVIEEPKVEEVKKPASKKKVK